MTTTSKKNFIGIIIVYSILLVLLNVLVFIVFKPWNYDIKIIKLDFWFSYSFLTLAFILQFGSILAIKRNNGAIAIFMGIPLTVLSGIYFLIEAFLSLLFMILAAFSVKTPTTLVIILQVLLLGLYLIVAVIALMTKNTISDIDKNNKQKVQNIRILVDQVEIAISMCDDNEVKKLLERFSEDIRYSDPMSIDAVIGLDNKLTCIIEDIKNAVAEKDYEKTKKLVQSGKLTVLERNKMIATQK